MKKESIEILAAHMEIEPGFLHECLRIGALDENELPDDPLEVPAARLARLRRMQRLCLALEVDAFAGAIIVDLLERLEDIQNELDRRR